MSELLGGRYELGEVIGRGGMAQVFRATDVRLGRQVAVKVLRPELARDPDFQARFRREAQAAASLDAPTVVAVYDTGSDAEGVPWIVMELVEGRTLRDVLHDEGRLLPQRAMEITADICSALQVAHAAGMVHRDIKPANVMLTSTGEVKVMDFGIARAAAASSATMTQTAAVLGTAAYLSPEQARGEHVDARSDLYSTGCLLYELVTGVPPFVGDSPVAVAYQHVREDPVPPTEFDPSMSADVDAVVLKAMAKNPENRYVDADDMREDLLRAVAGQPVLATPVLVVSAAAADEVVIQRVERQRRTTLAWTLFGALLLAVALGAGLLVHALLGNDSGLLKPPTVVGSSQQDAAAQLQAAGLQVGRVTAGFSPAAVGTVLTQSPDGHFFVRRGGLVDLLVSQGPERTTVPGVVGASQDDATATLGAAELVARVTTRDGDVPAGTVLSVLPAAGTQLAARSTVTLVVASGNLLVPDVRGTIVQQAVKTLGASSFVIGIRYVVTTTTPGQVLAQDPVGTLARREATVVLDVAQTPVPTATPTPAAPAPPPTPGPGAPAPSP